jgi:hypothetical protein
MNRSAVMKFSAIWIAHSAPTRLLGNDRQPPTPGALGKEMRLLFPGLGSPLASQRL